MYLPARPPYRRAARVQTTPVCDLLYDGALQDWCAYLCCVCRDTTLHEALLHACQWHERAQHVHHHAANHHPQICG